MKFIQKSYQHFNVSYISYYVSHFLMRTEQKILMPSKMQKFLESKRKIWKNINEKFLQSSQVTEAERKVCKLFFDIHIFADIARQLFFADRFRLTFTLSH